MPARRPPYLAYLRVFEPVAHLPAPARERWTAYAESAPSRHRVEAEQFAQTVRRLAGRPPVPVPPAESLDALVLEVDGARYVCPQQPRLQVWQGLEAGAVLAPLVVPGAAVPETLREQAVADLASYAGSGGEVRLFTRSAIWQVPIAWFVPFTAAERRLDLDGARSLTYRTTMSRARRRCALGLRTARRHLEDVDVVADIEQVARWLEEFDPRSLVELDYAGLVDLLDDIHLTGDDSAGDVALGLEALADEDATSAAAAYQRLATRWRRVALLARSS